jgi:glycosyltransferase involved in cell wall biosynthesis
MSKVIWYCHHYAGSPTKGMSYRPYYLTKAFNQAGMNAYVIGANNHHLMQGEVEQTGPVHLDGSEDIPFITIKTKPYAGNGIGRMVNALGYAWGLKRHYRKLINITGKPDAIIVSSGHPFHFPVMKKIAKKLKAKLIFEVRDLWPLSLQQLTNLSSWHPLCLWLSTIEKSAYKNADHVVTLLDNSFEHMQSKGLSEVRFKIIPNGLSLDDYRQSQPIDLGLLTTLQTLRQSGQFLLGYTGALGPPNAMEYLIDAMALLAKKHLPIHAVLVGNGGLKVQLEQKARALGLSNITFVDAIPKKQIPSLLKEMDGLYLGWNDASIYEYGVSPNKVFDYMMASKPIIESGGSPTKLIEQVGCGINCKAASGQDIADAIVNLATLSDKERKEMGLRGKQYVMEHHNYETLAKAYIQLL